jgi:hypothetical protein
MPPVFTVLNSEMLRELSDEATPSHETQCKVYETNYIGPSKLPKKGESWKRHLKPARGWVRAPASLGTPDPFAGYQP